MTMRRFFWVGIWLMAMMPMAHALTPVGLKCEYRENPVGVDVVQPRLTWVYPLDASTPRGWMQSAYQIRVATSLARLTSDRADLWDTGKVAGSQTRLITYAGEPLKPEQQCFWQVRTWDAEGVAGEWSAPAHWTMGLMEQAGWKAPWMGPDPVMTRELLPAAYMRKEFSVRAGLKRALVHATAAGLYELHLNGAKVSEDCLAPGWTEYEKRMFYRTYDVTDLIRAGAKNAVGAILGDGWYGLHHQGRGITRLRMQMSLEYADGSRELVMSDGSWTYTRNGPVRSSDIYQGEAYDARLELHGWATVGYDDGDWAPVAAGPLFGETWVDVTDRLRAAIEAGAETFAVSREDLGEPVRGRDLHLEVNYVVGGETHRMAVPEGRSVILSRTGERPQPSIELIKAEYGAQDTWVDVTEKVRPALRNGRLEVAATNAAFGDPIYNVVKRLRVFYKMNGEDGRAEVTENQTLTIDPNAYLMQVQGAQIEEARFGIDIQDPIAGAVFEAHPGNPVKEMIEIPTQTVSEPQPDVYVLDLGQNFTGWFRFRASSERGRTVRLRFAEMLNDDGTIYTENLRGAKCTDYYTFAGSAEEVWTPQFTFHGYRYVELTGMMEPPTPETITGIALYSESPDTSTFECSVPLVNQLYRNTVWGQRSNFLEIPTDCPQRDERMGWSGDAQVFIRTAAYNMDVGPFFTAWMKSFNDSQTSDGAYPNVSPKGWGVSPAWGDAGVICPFMFYWAYGDTKLIREHYDGMCAWIDYLKTRSTDLIRPAEGFGDWLNVDAPMPKEVISTAYFAWSTQLLSELAEIIGKPEDAERYRALAAEIKSAFAREFISEDGRIHGDTQTCYLMALSFGLVPSGLQEAAADRLVELIEERDYHLSTGFLGVNLLLPTLTDIGRLDLAYRLLQNTTYPSWGYSIVNGATTIWERWNSYTKEHGFGDAGMNSFNHYAYGSCGEWMFGTLAGIAPDLPGYERIRIAPRPHTDMEYVAATYDSIRGRIATRWELADGELTLDVTIPPNTTAHVQIPCADPESLKEGGRPVIGSDELAGCRFSGLENGTALVQIGSGTYRFTSQMD